MKTINGFAKWVSRPSMTELSIFKASSKQLRCKHHRRPLDLGRGEAHLSFRFILAQFGGL
jgi:hypothetical protein